MLEKKIQKGLEDLNFEQVQFEIHLSLIHIFRTSVKAVQKKTYKI